MSQGENPFKKKNLLDVKRHHINKLHDDTLKKNIAERKEQISFTKSFESLDKLNFRKLVSAEMATSQQGNQIKDFIKNRAKTQEILDNARQGHDRKQTTQ